VQGPLSTLTPLPVYPAKLTGTLNPVLLNSDSGTLTTVLGDQEVCKGTWQFVRPVAKGPITGDPGAYRMATEWDFVYGQGFYVSHVLGARTYLRAVLTGNKGTVLNVEMYMPNDEADKTASSIKGVAKDNKDNVFKLAF
jgi:hypothetical protein